MSDESMDDIGTVPQQPAAPSAAAAGMVNRVLSDRYEVLEAVGEGLLLAAYRARDRQQNRMVAAKVLLPAYRGNAEIEARLKSGLGQVFTFNHPNIARLLDAGVDPATSALFYAEELMRGIDLKERIRRAAPLSLTAATDIAIAAAEALEYAHARGVAHGDVRPQNVLVGAEGQIKLTGFGLAPAQTVAIAEDPTLLRRVVSYAAPDTAGTGAVTPSADLYSLGVLLYEMLTGDLPYAGDGPIQIALKHAQAAIPSPRAANQGVPRALEGIVMKSLGKRPADRYAAAADLLKDLRAVRDALRYGKPLSWSPLDTGEAAAAVAAPVAAAATVTAGPMVMPSAAAAPAPAPPRPVATVPTPPQETVTAKPAKAAPRDMDDDYPPAPRRSSGGRWLLALNLFLGTVFIGACAYLAWLVLFFLKPPQEVIVPNLQGKQLAEAQTTSLERHFKVEVIDRQANDKVPEGVILQQRPEAGRHILEGKTVSVWVSKGPNMVEVPGVVDMSFEAARRELEKGGLRVGQRKSEYDPITAAGNVIRQMPEAGEERARGTRIDLVLSRGPEPLPTADDTGSDPVVVEPTPTPTPPSAGGNDTPAPGDDKTSYLTVNYAIPSDAAAHHIRIDVTDKNGVRTVYDEVREAGENLNQDVEGVGKKITIKVYDNDVQVDEVTGPPWKKVNLNR